MTLYAAAFALSLGALRPAIRAKVAAFGALWAWLYHRSGSLAGPWLGHLLADAATFTNGRDLLR